MKQVRLWIYQCSYSGNANGHFEMLELPIKSSKKDVVKEALKTSWKCFNIQNLGVFNSRIGDKDFCHDNIGKNYKQVKTRS